VREKNCAALAALKPRIRDAVAEEWKKSLATLSSRLEAWKPKEEPRRKGKTPPSTDTTRRSLAAWQRLQNVDAGQMAAEWKKLAGEWKEMQTQRAAFEKQDAFVHWDLSGGDGKQWFADGNGLRGGSQAGEFSLGTEEDEVIARIHPAGMFTDLLSTKHRGVLSSTRFKAEGGRLWVKLSGGGGSRVRYVVQNYPRSGTIHLKKDMEDEQGSEWTSWDMDYWKGDTLYMEGCTNADMPAEGRSAERSWFGISEVVYAKDKNILPPQGGVPLLAVLDDKAAAPTSRAELVQVYAAALGRCIDAWRGGSMTNDQADFLNAALQSGLLPNTAHELPGSAALVAQYRKLEADVPVPTRAPGVLEADSFDQPLFVRGSHKTPADLVPRRFLEALDDHPYKPANSGRLQLAESLTSPTNPLASRIIVNRLWHYVFGRGIVATTDNFGKLGELPTHPELLDYLASRFAAHGGSIKDMMKFLMTSQTFQLDDHAPAGAREKDPENLLLTHFSVRRLDAEAIRDSILALSGKLQDSMYGESVSSGETRRSVYLKVIRNNLDPFLAVFDEPVPSSSRGNRDSTNVPAQSLALLNDPTVIDWSENWAKRIRLNKSGGDDAARVKEMFDEAFGHPPTAEELTQCTAYLRSIGAGSAASEAELASLTGKVSELQKKIDALLSPVRDQLAAKHDSAKAVEDVPVPMAEWDFKDGGRDLHGKLDLTLRGSAQIEDGALLLDGEKSFAESPPLTRPLREKTLEAWLKLDDLNQRGAGVMSVQTKDGAVFDAIVFAEKEAQCWLAGSNFFKRTKSFSGEPEEGAIKYTVHVALVYRADGTIEAYRAGEPYGKPYQSQGPQEFDAGKCNVVFGLRHSPAGGNKMLRGRILRARLYDRALSRAEIAASSKLESALASDDDLLAGLPENDRASVQRMREELRGLNTKLADLRQTTAGSGPEAAWSSLAQSLVNLKEFIYLR
jgi:hypothetical protein